MPSSKPSALKKLSDDALRKRLQEMEDGLKEMSARFDAERTRLFGEVEKGLNELEQIDMRSRLEPILKDGEEQLDKMHKEFLQSIERERKMFEEVEGDKEEEGAAVGKE